LAFHVYLSLSSFPGRWTLSSAHLKKEKKAPGEKLPALTPVPDDAESGKFLPVSQAKIASLKI
jgi:hypothetical protein